MTTQRYKNIILTVVLNLVWTLNSIACSCEGKATVSASVKHSDFVFSGQVIFKTLTTKYDSLGIIATGDTSKKHFKWRNYPTAVVRIRVDKMYKGKLTSKILTVLTPPNGAGCGYSFKVGKKYIIYATIFDEMLGTDRLKRRTFDNKTFWTHQCTRTGEWNSIEEKEILKIKI